MNHWDPLWRQSWYVPRAPRADGNLGTNPRSLPWLWISWEKRYAIPTEIFTFSSLKIYVIVGFSPQVDSFGTIFKESSRCFFPTLRLVFQPLKSLGCFEKSSKHQDTERSFEALASSVPFRFTARHRTSGGWEVQGQSVVFWIHVFFFTPQIGMKHVKKCETCFKNQSLVLRVENAPWFFSHLTQSWCNCNVRCNGPPTPCSVPWETSTCVCFSKVCGSSPRKRIFKSSQGRILLEHTHVSGMCRTCVHVFEMIHPDLSEYRPGLVDKMNNQNLLIPRELSWRTPGP